LITYVSDRRQGGIFCGATKKEYPYE